MLHCRPTTPILIRFRGKKFWELIISSPGNLQNLSVRIPSEICSVCWKIATSCAAYFFNLRHRCHATDTPAFPTLQLTTTKHVLKQHWCKQFINELLTHGHLHKLCILKILWHLLIYFNNFTEVNEQHKINSSAYIYESFVWCCMDKRDRNT